MKEIDFNFPTALRNSTFDLIDVAIGPSFELIKGLPGMHPGTPL